MHNIDNNQEEIQVGKEIFVCFYYFKHYCLLEIGDKKYLVEINKILKNKRTIRLVDDTLFKRRSRTF